MSENRDKPSMQEVMATFSIIAVFLLAISLALAAILSLIGGTSVLTEVLKAIALTIAIAIVAINSVNAAKKIKSKGWFWAWIIAMIIVVIFLVLMFVAALKA